MSKEAMKLALEASEVLEALFNQAEAMHEDMTAGVNVHCQITVADLSKGLYAAAAIREALAEKPAQQQQQFDHTAAANAALRDAQNRSYQIARAAQQEPVAWMCSDESLANKGYSRFSRTCEGAWNIPVYTSPPANANAGKPLTLPQIAKALADAGLRPEDYREDGMIESLVRAIEAKRKEKNT